MPDRDLFESCGDRMWRSAYNALYRDESDPNLVPIFISVLQRDLEEVASALKAIAVWHASGGMPLDLFQSLRPAAPLADIPVELRERVGRALPKKSATFAGSAPTVDGALVLILAGLAGEFAMNSCAIHVAKSKFGLSHEEITGRIQVLKAKLVDA